VVISLPAHEFTDVGKIRHQDVYLQPPADLWLVRPPATQMRIRSAPERSECA
jgi:hypothetical protein